jgi:hypothetical protein
MPRVVAEIERSHWSIVLLGGFNPSIFHPAWFGHHGIISAEDVGAAETQIVHAEVASMLLGNQLKVICERERFQAETAFAPEIRLLDLVSKVFGDVLPHSKIRSFGVNKSVHFRASSNERRMEIGRQVAPLGPWGAFGDRISQGIGENAGGMMSLRMREMRNEDEHKGHVEARIEPSNALDSTTGIFIGVNRHVELREYDEVDGALPALQKLDQIFEVALAEADQIINQFLEKA